MLRLIKRVIVGSVLLVPMFISAGNYEQITKERMKSDLDVIHHTFEVSYAPKEWKKTYANWDLDAEIQKAKEQIDQATHITVKSYQKIVRNFFNSTKDYHVGVWFYSTERSSLPFRVKGAKGRYFISYIDKERLSPSVFSVNVGDELVSFNGRPTHDVINELLKNESRSSNEGTDRGFAEYMLTNRASQFGQTVPKGPIMIGLKSAATQKMVNYQLIWNYIPEKITNRSMAAVDLWHNSEEHKPLLQQKFFNKKMLMPMGGLISDLKGEENLIKEDEQAENEFLGGRGSFIPDLGKIWWRNDKSSLFKAYIYENNEHRLIGYVRIPHYMGYDYEVSEFAWLISFFQQHSDALVIDQVNNPGGFLFFAYALASMFAEKPFYTPKHRITITQEDVAFSVSAIPVLERISSDSDAQAVLGPTFFGMEVTHQMSQFFLDYLNFVLSEWNAGRTLTNPYFLYSIDKINSHPTSLYTKPVVLVTNGLDISCGDFFPAILQDNKRATLFGARTAGGGGYVVPETFPNRFGIAGFSYTASIAERVDKNPIENLGVVPDVPYEITPEDLQNNYRGYVQALNGTVADLLSDLPRLEEAVVPKELLNSNENKEQIFNDEF